MRIPTIAFAALLACSPGLAQAPDDSRPARTNVLGAEHPRVTGDARAVFPFKAPGAQRVQVDIMGVKYGTAFESPGTSHEWLTWRRSLNDVAPRLFRK